MGLDEIAEVVKMSMDEFLDELYAIVHSGTKVNIDYYLEEELDEYTADDLKEYFMEAETDDPEVAFKELHEDDITMDEIRLYRIKFLSDVAN